MATKLDIVNLALTEFGNRRLESLTAKNATARAVRAVYDIALGETLEAIDWNFARKSEALALVAQTSAAGVQPVPGFEYIYAVPNGSVKVRKVFPEGASHVSEQERVEGQSFEETTNPGTGATVIATDIEDAYATFTARIDDVSRWPASAQSALAANIASKIVMDLTQEKTLKADMEQLFLLRVSNAARLNGHRENAKKPRSGGYLDCR